MKNFTRHLGLIGVLLILGGGLGLGMASEYPGFYVIPWALAVICLALYSLNHLNEIRIFISSRSAKFGAGSALGVIIVLAIVVIIAVLTSRHSARYDLTTNKRYSLSPQTIKILEGLKLEVRVTGFFQSEGPAKEKGKDLFDQYAHVSRLFKYEIVDPDRNPARAKNAAITRYDTVVIDTSGKNEKITSLTEDHLTNAILRVTKSGKKAIYFLTGHGERNLEEFGKNGYSSVKTLLGDKNYDIKTLLLLQEQEVPKDTSALVIAGPQKDLMPKEIEALDRYLHQGGKALFLIDPQTVPELVKFMTKFNVKIGDDIIVDKMSRLFGADYLTPLVAQYTQHPITENFNMASFFPLARSVTVDKNKIEGVKAVTLASTSDQSWAETDLETLKQGRAEFDADKDIKGPVSVAVVGTIKAAASDKKDKESAPKPEETDQKEKEGKIIVFGNSAFAVNSYLNLQGNSDLFMNSLSWLAEEADLMAIRAKDQASQPLMLSQAQIRLIFWIPVVIIPLIILVVGVLILTSRRRQQ
ncbi:MAG: GldG family protein [Deltaproteobacteria bacterium]|nr:GldG family protein [Deltaproteobacteria bacterium]